MAEAAAAAAAAARARSLSLSSSKEGGDSCSVSGRGRRRRRRRVTSGLIHVLGGLRGLDRGHAQRPSSPASRQHHKMLVQEPVQAAIWHCLNHYSYADATFLAERLFAEVHNDESLHLLATCYYRSGQLNQAYDLLREQGHQSPQSKFLMAKCCTDLHKLAEAEAVLNGRAPLDPLREPSPDDASAEFGDAAAFALQLQASVYAQTQRASKANDCQRRALKLNPFLWQSFEKLCSAGQSPDPGQVFNLAHVDTWSHCHGVNPILNAVNHPHHHNNPGLSTPGPETPAQKATEQQQHHLLPPPPPAKISVARTSTPNPLNSQSTSTPTPAGLDSSEMAIDITPTQDRGQGQHNMSDSVFTPTNQPSSIVSSSCGSGGSFRHQFSGLKTINYSSDATAGAATPSDSTGHAHHLPLTSQRNNQLMPPPIRRKPHRQPQQAALTAAANQAASAAAALSAADAAANSANDSFLTPTFGILPRGPTLPKLAELAETRAEPRLAKPSLALRLDFSSPSLSVLSPFNLNTQATSVNNDSLSPSPPAVGLAGNEKAPLKQKRTIMSSKENPLKPNVFGQSSNTGNITTPANPQIVRRSSRLHFGSTQSSVKENSSKAPATKKTSRSLKSPSRKIKNRMSALSSSPAELEEKNEKNNKESSAGTAPAPLIGQHDDQSRTPVQQQPVQQQQQQPQPNLGAQALVIQKQSAEGLMQLMRKMGAAYAELANYNSRKAIQLLEAVPWAHRNTGWALGLVGKAHFELGEYKEAKSFFKQLRDREPFRLEFMEYYSTCLWHLQDDVELSALAQELTRIDKFSPQAWCAAGNCFSHLKEHENAIKFFQRAAQVDPTFAYAYTLLGHEYVMIEELEKAMACFRSAVRVDPRHYNAWYGVGLTYYKQERFQLADIYYRQALAINPLNPILMCHVAVVQHALQRTDKALQTLNTAIRQAPRNSLCKFERASILFAAERYNEALLELNELKELVPKESPVYFLLGKVHNKLNNTHLALMHFSWAMDLDPKGANSQIKDALDPTLNRAAQEDGGEPGDADADGGGGEDDDGSGQQLLAAEGAEADEMMQTGPDISDSFLPDDAGQSLVGDELRRGGNANASAAGHSLATPTTPLTPPLASTSAVSSSAAFHTPTTSPSTLSALASTSMAALATPTSPAPPQPNLSLGDDVLMEEDTPTPTPLTAEELERRRNLTASLSDESL